MDKFFTIGGIKIILKFEPESYNISLDRALEAFSSESFETPDVIFRIDITSDFPSLDSYRILFTTNPKGSWTILEDMHKSHYLIAFHNPHIDNKPFKIVKANRNLSDLVIHSKPDETNMLFPLEYPLSDLVVAGYINTNKIGVILHSACISIRGKGFLFSGASGSGKSTLSEIWRKDSETEVLTDERVIIRNQEGDLWAFGTPWHGTAEIHKNMGVPIEKIFFIKHGKENRARQISKTDAANRLMVRCFPTFWNREGMQFVLDFCTRIASEKECYELEFIRDASVMEYVKKLFS
jgi:hypothetical protein